MHEKYKGVRNHFALGGGNGDILNCFGVLLPSAAHRVRLIACSYLTALMLDAPSF